MILSDLLLTILFSSTAGIGYSFLFLAQQGRKLSYKISSFIARILISWQLGIYLLHHPPTISILAVSSFVATFWLMILLIRTRFHEWI